MTPEEAIEILEQAPLDDEHIFSLDLRDAIELGIGALKQVKLEIEHGYTDFYDLHPGETFD